MKNKLFIACFKSNNADKKACYKKYRNKLTHITYHAKRNYYENLIKSNNRNPSQTWSVIKEITECKKPSQKSKLPSVLLIENQMIDTDSHEFPDKLCEYFANIGTKLANNVPKTNNSSKILPVAACSHLLFKKYVKKMLFLALTMLNLTPHQDQMKSLQNL